MDEKYYRELYELKRKLHEIVKSIIFKTNCGSIEESGVGGKGIEELILDIAEGSLYSCFYYEQVTFSSDEEYELDDNLDAIRKIVYELEKILEKIDEEIDEKIDEEHFQNILNKKIDLGLENE